MRHVWISGIIFLLTCQVANATEQTAVSGVKYQSEVIHFVQETRQDCFVEISAEVKNNEDQLTLRTTVNMFDEGKGWEAWIHYSVTNLSAAIRGGDLVMPIRKGWFKYKGEKNIRHLKTEWQSITGMGFKMENDKISVSQPKKDVFQARISIKDLKKIFTSFINPAQPKLFEVGFELYSLKQPVKVELNTPVVQGEDVQKLEKCLQLLEKKK